MNRIWLKERLAHKNADRPDGKVFCARKLATWLLGIFCLSILTGCENFAQKGQLENTNSFPEIGSETLIYFYGPPPVTPSELSANYLQRFQEAFRWQMGVASDKENFKPKNLGELSLQFHLNSDGSISDLMIFTNTMGSERVKICKLALFSPGKAYEPWPKEMCKKQFAGYFMIRTLIYSQPATNLGENFESAVDIGTLTGTYPSNAMMNVLTNFAADPTYLAVGMSQMRTNNFLQATSNFTKAIEVDSGDVWAYSGLGFCLDELKNYDAATTNLSQAIELDPQNASAWNALGMVELHFKDYTNVVADASKAIALDPDLRRAYESRAYAKKRLRDFDGALEDAER